MSQEIRRPTQYLLAHQAEGSQHLPEKKKQKVKYQYPIHDGLHGVRIYFWFFPSSITGSDLHHVIKDMIRQTDS